MKAGKIRKPHKKVSILLAAAVLVIAACSSSNSNITSDSIAVHADSSTINETSTTLPMTCEKRGLQSIERQIENFESEGEREMRSESRWDDPDIDYILDNVFPIESESLQHGEVACLVQTDVRVQDGNFRDTQSVSMVFCMNFNAGFMGSFSGTEMLAAVDECLAALRGAPEKPDFTELSDELQEQIAAFSQSRYDVSSCEETLSLYSSSSYRGTELFYTELEECLSGATSVLCIETDRIAKAVKSETSTIVPEYKHFRDLRSEYCQLSCDVFEILEDSSDSRIRGIIQDTKDKLFEQTQIEC